MDLIKKPDFYQIQPEWIAPFPPVPIISTPAYGNMAAVKVCELKKVNSPKDKKVLEEAKELVYKEGFYSGVMIVGECKDK
jgi:leucyl-tRNA synthetase